MRDGKQVVLCVDDEQDILDGLRMVLEAEGYLVETASNGKEGLRVFSEVAPDLVLVDMMMETYDAGLNLARLHAEFHVRRPPRSGRSEVLWTRWGAPETCRSGGPDGDRQSLPRIGAALGGSPGVKA